MSDDAAKIPTTTFEFALWALILRQEAEFDPNLTEPTRAAILEQFDTLSRAIVTLNNLCAASLSQTEAARAGQAIAEGLHAAIRIGAYHPDAPRTPPTRAAIKKRMRATHAGRRRDEFQEIVCREVKELWDRRKDLKGDFVATAREICDAIAAEIPRLPKPPKGYETADLTDRKTRDRLKDLLRHRVAKCVKDVR
jgi:hypothetical protein